MTEAQKIEVGAPAPSALILGAAAWLVGQAPPPNRPIPEIRARFDLTPKEACQACSLADQLRRQQHGGSNG